MCMRACAVVGAVCSWGAGVGRLPAARAGVLLLVAVLWALLVLAAVIDARQRRFPRVLGCAIACVSAALSALVGGLARLAWCTCAACAFGAVLTVAEMMWRRRHAGRPGLGMGDVKFLAALSLWAPLDAVLSLAGALVLLAWCGLLLRRDSLPLLPFAVPVFAVVRAARLLGWAS